MNELHRDPFVTRALAELSVPEHGAQFWSDLEARFDDEDRMAGEQVLTRPRRGRWPAPRMLVAAAALAVVVGAAVLVAGDDGTRVETGNAGETTEPTSPASPTTDVPPTTISPVAGARTQTRPSPDAAVTDWIEALGRGDEQTAAALVGARSRRYIESLGGNVEGFMRESEEGYGAWAASPDRSTTEIDLGSVDGAATTIVVVTGTWRGEGTSGFRADAIPAVRVGRGWMVEPVAFDPEVGGRLEVLSPAPNGDGTFSPMPPDGALSAAAPGHGDFYFSLDDHDPVRIVGQPTGGGVRASWDPPGTLPRQTHLFVIAYVAGDTLTAFAGRFTVG